MHLVDNETKVDLLNNERIAATVVKLLRSTSHTAVTIGLHGDWGAGKSSLLAMIEAAFADDRDVLCLRFNGWLFQGFEDAKVVLLEKIVTELVRSRTLSAKAKELAKNLMSRIDWLKVAKKAGGLLFTAHTGIPTPDLIDGITSGFIKLLDDPAEVVSKDALKDAITGAKEVMKDSEPKHVPDEIHAFREEFDKLLTETGTKQLIVLIDDLDRCLPKPAIETLEAIRLFLFTPRTAFVVAADEAMIEYAVREHFPDLPAASGPLTYARNYLEKLIQVPFRIPALGAAETRIYTTLLLIQAEVGEDNPEFLKLLATARELLKRPWRNPVLDRAAVEAAMGRLAPEVQAAITLSQQISPDPRGRHKGQSPTDQAFSQFPLASIRDRRRTRLCRRYNSPRAGKDHAGRALHATVFRSPGEGGCQFGDRHGHRANRDRATRPDWGRCQGTPSGKGCRDCSTSGAQSCRRTGRGPRS